MILQELKKLKLQSELMSIRRHCSEDNLTGSVELITDELVVLCLWNDEGRFNGFTLFELSQINEVIWGSRELKAIAMLVKRYGEKPSFSLKSQSFFEALDELSQRYSTLCLYHEHGENSFDIAKVENQSGEWIKISTFGPKRTLTRTNKLIYLKHILRITVDSPYQSTVIEVHKENL